MTSWKNLYKQALSVCNGRDLSNSVYAGSVAAAILTTTGKSYLGVSVDTKCSLGFCAERNALGSLITNDDTDIVKLVIVRANGDLLLPCGACRELLMQLKPQNNIKILTNLNRETTISLTELLPHYWE
ncbi:cytidine deaminase [Fructilactobacillus vespulae]|uniref:cytidine deaminase family protein n=1 Tax=Fructilactobacillus vespulae TaxID=1249630 RepID=UPI0039B632B0